MPPFIAEKRPFSPGFHGYRTGTDLSLFANGRVFFPFFFPIGIRFPHGNRWNESLFSSKERERKPPSRLFFKIDDEESLFCARPIPTGQSMRKVASISAAPFLSAPPFITINLPTPPHAQVFTAQNSSAIEVNPFFHSVKNRSFRTDKYFFLQSIVDLSPPSSRGAGAVNWAGRSFFPTADSTVSIGLFFA